MRKLTLTARFLPLGALLCALLLLFSSGIAAAAPRQQSGAAPSVAVGDSSLGQILVGPNGMSLYMFDKDEPNKSNCYEGCAVKWPPLLVNAGEQPTAGEGVTAKLGVTERTDGTYQVTANGWPLYYWYKDVNPGDVLGQAVGDVWWVLAADGTINRTAPVSAEATPAATAEATTEATAEAPAEAAAPAQLPVTGADGGTLGALIAALGIAAGGGWVVLRRRR
jgi:LPXTG-motif cell wall-anchored protein